MSYNQGESVVHHQFGVGTVVGIETMNVNEELRQFYRVSFDRTMLWVPVAGSSSGIRPITTKGNLAPFREVLKSSPSAFEGDFRQRQAEMTRRVDSGTFQGLCEIVRDLSARLSGKPLNLYEFTLLKRSREALITEWSAASGCSSDQALDEIDGYLRHSMEQPPKAQV